MVNFAEIISNEWLIIVIEACAGVLLVISFFYTQKIHQMTKRTTDIWLLISFVVFTSFLVSLFNAAEYYYGSQAFHDIAEYLKNIYSLVWIYIAYRFISLRKIEKKI